MEIINYFVVSALLDILFHRWSKYLITFFKIETPYGVEEERRKGEGSGEWIVERRAEGWKGGGARGGGKEGKEIPPLLNFPLLTFPSFCNFSLLKDVF